MNSDRNIVEIAIIGGGAAGLSAALFLGRARRKVIVIDDNKPRNADVKYAYGFYTRDKTPPEEIRQIGQAQLRQYDVSILSGRAVTAQRTADGFLITLDNGTTIKAQKLLLAPGIADDPPDIPGLKELWGKNIFTCPYCDGWEVREKPLAVLNNGKKGYEFVLMIRHWSKDVILLTDGPADLDVDQRDYLARHDVPVIEDRLAEIRHEEGTAIILFKEGNRLQRQAIFTQPDCHLRDAVALQLGCEFEKDGVRIIVDDTGRTTVPGVYAAGDAATKHSLLIMAAASGTEAALAINHDMIEEVYPDKE